MDIILAIKKPRSAGPFLLREPAVAKDSLAQAVTMSTYLRFLGPRVTNLT